MKLLIDKIEFEIIEKSSEKFLLKLLNTEDIIFYEGHFESFKLLPALAQIHLCVEVCKNQNFIFNHTKLTNLKFKTPIRPLDSVFLTTELIDHKIHFKYTKETNSADFYSKGIIG